MVLSLASFDCGEAESGSSTPVEDFQVEYKRGDCPIDLSTPRRWIGIDCHDRKDEINVRDLPLTGG